MEPEKFSVRSVVNWFGDLAGEVLFLSSIFSYTLSVVTEPITERRVEFLSFDPQVPDLSHSPYCMYFVWGKLKCSAAVA